MSLLPQMFPTNLARVWYIYIGTVQLNSFFIDVRRPRLRRRHLVELMPQNGSEGTKSFVGNRLDRFGSEREPHGNSLQRYHGKIGRGCS